MFRHSYSSLPHNLLVDRGQDTAMSVGATLLVQLGTLKHVIEGFHSGAGCEVGGEAGTA